MNWDDNVDAAAHGDRFTTNIQPVVPISLNQDWNLISRTILPVVRQSDIFPGAGSQTGMGDTVQSPFSSPKAPTAVALRQDGSLTHRHADTVACPAGLNHRCLMKYSPALARCRSIRPLVIFTS